MAYPIMAIESTWYKASVARSTITEIHIVDSYTPNGSEDEVWNADDGDAGEIKGYRNGTVVTIAGNGSGKIAAHWNSQYLFSDEAKEDFFTSLTIITGAELLDTSEVKSFYGAFTDCNVLESVDVSQWDTKNVIYFGYMFLGCWALKSLNVSRWNTSSATALNVTFAECRSLTTLDVSNWDVSKVQTLYSTFHDCRSLETIDVSKWDTSSVTNMKQLFYHCDAVKTLDVSNWDVSKVTTFVATFHLGDSSSGLSAALTELDVSKWDTSSAEDMSYMFWGNKSKLGQLDVSNFNTSKVTSFALMFAQSCLVLTGDNIKNWDTSAAVNMNCMLHSTRNTEFDVSKWDTSNNEHFQQLFEYCINLERIIGLENFNTSKGRLFGEMFNACHALKELNLSSFDTQNTQYMLRMFDRMYALEKITLSSLFRFDVVTPYEGLDSVPAVLPTPSSEYIPGADGRWYVFPGGAYASEEVPNFTAQTYYASRELVPDGPVAIRNSYFLDFADTIRSTPAGAGKYTPNEMLDAVSELADSVNAQYDAGYNAAVQAEYDRFWDAYQNYGNAKNYEAYFFRFPAELYDPKYDFMFNDGYSANNTFRCFEGTDLKKNCDFTRTAQYGLNYTFYEATKLVNARTLTVVEANTYTGTFTRCGALEEIRFNGVIGNTIQFNESPKLSHDSLMSIISALGDYSGGTGGTSRTLMLGDTNLAKLTTAEKAIVTGKGWTLT